MSAVKLAKTALRKEIESKIGSISVEERTRQSDVVLKKLLGLEQFKTAKFVSIFLSLDTEVNTEPIVRKIFQDGKRCFVPRYNKNAMEMVELYSMEDWSTLPVTKWNIKQPSFKDKRTNCHETGLDLIVTPGVAFTASGGRLGHGGGYYDRFLKDIKERQTTPTYVIAVGFKEQIVDELPLEETDVKVDMVLFAE